MNRIFGLLLILITIKQVIAQNNQVSVLNRKISLEAKNETTPMLLKRIEKQIGRGFSYDSKIIDSKKKQTVSFKEKTVSESISLLFDHKIGCKVKGNYIVLYKNAVTPVHHSFPPESDHRIKKALTADASPFLRPSKTKNDTTIRYFVDIIVPGSSGKDSVIQTESIEVPTTHILQIKDDTTIILLKKDMIPPK